MKGKTRQRESNMELLRILAMFFIIMFHIVFLAVYPQLNDNGHFPDGVAYFDAAQFNKKLLIPALIMPLGNVGNDIFLLISGYFMAVRFDNKKENGGQRNGFLKYKTPVNILQIAEKLLFCGWNFGICVILHFGENCAILLSEIDVGERKIG